MQLLIFFMGMKTKNSFYIPADRAFAKDGVEIWKYHTDWLVVSKVGIRYGKFYAIHQYEVNELFDIDPLLRRTFHGVNVKFDPDPIRGG